MSKYLLNGIFGYMNKLLSGHRHRVPKLKHVMKLRNGILLNLLNRNVQDKIYANLNGAERAGTMTYCYGMMCIWERESRVMRKAGLEVYKQATQKLTSFLRKQYIKSDNYSKSCVTRSGEIDKIYSELFA